MHTITSGVLRDAPRGEPATLTLTSQGWTWLPGEGDDPLAAVTSDSIDAWTGGEPLTTEDADAFLGEAADDYRVRAEDGSTDAPKEDTDWAVVTARYAWTMERSNGHSLPVGEPLDWREAYWIDLDTLTQVLVEAEAGWGLYLTRLGHWVVAHDAGWLEVQPRIAADFVYDADPRRRAEDLPRLAAAASVARDLADMCAWPEPETDDVDEAERQDWAARDAAIEHVHTVRIIGDLARTRVQSDIRVGRGGAARTVKRAHDGNVTHAAAALGVTRQTFLDLIK